MRTTAVVVVVGGVAGLASLSSLSPDHCRLAPWMQTTPSDKPLVLQIRQMRRPRKKRGTTVSMIKSSKSCHHFLDEGRRPYLCVDNIQDSNMAEDRKGLEQHLLSHVLGDIADVNSQSVLLLCKYAGV